MRKELQSWHALGAWQNEPRKDAKNIIDSRWFVNWKMIDGQKAVKARLVVRGFKDFQADDLNTSASTASRWGQRVVNQAVVENKWDLFSFDVSTAFCKDSRLRKCIRWDLQLKGKFALKSPRVPCI